MTEVAKIKSNQPVTHEPDQSAPMVQMIERIAMSPDIPIERLEQMLAMKERMEDRAREDEDRRAKRDFHEALAAAQGEIPVVLKNRANDHTRSRYADLAAIEQQAMPVIRKHGFSVSAWSVPGADTGFQRVHFRVARGGHVEDMEDDFPLDGVGAQGKQNKTPLHAKGSTTTYGRRYMICAFFNIATSDDDGNAGGGAVDASTITPEQFTALRDLIEQAEADKGKLLAHFRIDHLGELPASKYGTADAMLRKKIALKGGEQ
jgi:hypothetical protein